MTETHPTPQIAIIMGSKSDWPVMQTARDILNEFDIPHEIKILSAHRTPDKAIEFGKSAKDKGLKVIIAGAGMAAHLAGIMSAMTHIPVLGVPLEGSSIHGMDALPSTVQMPGGIPVATFAIGKAGAKNAALFATSIMALSDNNLEQKLLEFRAAQTASIPEHPED